MALTVVDLKPNRQFIDPEFNGYKLSLDTIPIIKEDLDKPVSKVFLDVNQHSFLHVKLTGLHNHLTGETIDGTDIVYVIDKSWCIKKIRVDTSSKEKILIEDVFNIPKNEQATNGKFNVCLKFITDSLAVLSDGLGKLYLLQTDDRRYNNTWKLLFSQNILDNSNCFVIQDARFRALEHENELHCLLYTIEQDEIEKQFFNVLYWVVMKEVQDKLWTKSTINEIRGNGVLDYAYLEESCEALYIISDGRIQFIRDLDKTTIAESRNIKKKYCWSQTEDEITVQFKLPDNFNMDFLYINTTTTDIIVKINNHIVLNGQLCGRIDEYVTTWSVTNGLLEVKLAKQDGERTWTSLIPDDDSGEYVIHSIVAAEIHEKLAHLCSESQTVTPLGTTFNSQQIEECDFEEDKYTTFERLSGITREATHKVNINTHTLLLTVQNAPYTAPAIALRHDVDAYVWRPTMHDETFDFIHIGTLNAFGYVQASKQQRKFSVCAPDFSYCAICETSRHLLIYRQQKAIQDAELRHRITGRRIGHVARQQVVNLPDDEVLGIYASTSRLFLLTSKSIYVLIL